MEVAVRACPWHQIMINSGRGDLSERVSEVICRVENETWASEFSEKGGEKIDFERQARLCREMVFAGCGFGRRPNGL